MDVDIIKRYFVIDTDKLSANTDLLRLRSWEIYKIDYPDFIILMQHPVSKKEYCFKFVYDDLPISMQVIDSCSFSPLPFSSWPKGDFFIDNHSKLHGPFLCTPGIREYHTHSSHENETQWNYLSQDFRLPAILDTVYAHLLKADL